MVARSRVRFSRLLGVSLPAKLGWYLSRSRASQRRARPRRDPTDYRLRQRAERLLREQYRIRGRVLRRDARRSHAEVVGGGLPSPAGRRKTRP